MKQKNRVLIDTLIILGMVVFVFLMCQPLGRKWDEGTKEMFTGEEGVYSQDSDTFYYLRKAKEFTENGFSSIRIFVPLGEDPLVTYIPGEESDSMPVLLSAIAAFIWYVLHAIGIRVSIYAVAMHLCGGILALCTIPIYLFLRKRVSRSASICGAILGTLSTAYLQHSVTGFLDTDALICLFSLITILSLYECILAETKAEQIRYGFFAVIGVFALSASWSMFQIYVLIAIGIISAAIILSRLFFVKKNDRTLKVKIPIVVMFMMAIVAILMGWKKFYLLIRDTFSSVKGAGNWPSTYENVTEMARPGLLSKKSFWEIFWGLKSDYISYLGGMVAFVFLGISIVLYSVDTFKKKRRTEPKREEMLVRYFATIIWFLGSMIISTFGIRFTQFLILPAALIWAFGMDVVERMVGRISIEGKRILYISCSFIVYATLVYLSPIGATIAAAIVIIGGFFLSRIRGGKIASVALCVTLLLGVSVSAYIRGMLAVPMLEKPTVNAMTWIKDNSDEDSVIAEFWSWGYRYQYYAERRTVADGGSYSGSMNYWLATMLFTDDEKLSAGIARMLQSEGTVGTDYAVSVFGNESEACAVLKAVLRLPYKDAKLYLEGLGRLSEEEQVKVLSYTHPEDCPDIYLIADYENLVLSAPLGKLSQWSFTGENADRKATLVTEQSIEIPEEGLDAKVKLWAKGLTEELSLLYKQEGGKIHGYGVDSDGRTYDFIKTVYYKNGTKISETSETESGNKGEFVDDRVLIILEDAGRLSGVISDESFLNSLMFRLYLFDGEGQDTFTKVFEDEIPERVSGESSKIQRKIGTSNTRVYRNCGITVWKVNFE